MLNKLLCWMWGHEYHWDCVAQGYSQQSALDHTLMYYCLSDNDYEKLKDEVSK